MALRANDRKSVRNTLRISFLMVITLGLFRIQTVSIGVATVGAASEFALGVIIQDVGILGLGDLILRVVGVVGVRFANSPNKSRCSQVAADCSVYERLRHCFRLQDFEFAVAL